MGTIHIIDNIQYLHTLIYCLVYLEKPNSVRYFQMSFETTMIQPNLTQTIDLGGQLGLDSLAIMWQNGASSLQSGNFTVSSFYEATNKIPNLIFSSASDSTETFSSEKLSSEVFCEMSFLSSFCIDASTLTSAMASAGEAFLTEKFTSSTLSTSSCLKFCKSRQANVSKQIMLYWGLARRIGRVMDSETGGLEFKSRQWHL